MADEAPKSTGPFDVRTVKSLVALMSQHDLAEIDLRDGMQRLRLRRGQQTIAVSANPPLSMPMPAMSAAPAPASPAPATAKPEPTQNAKKLIEIKSVTVGTFYSAPSPDAPPFVRVGSKVSPETVVGLVEAMKLFNEITAECAGVIAEILVENKQSVEFGQVLYRVDPAG